MFQPFFLRHQNFFRLFKAIMSPQIKDAGLKGKESIAKRFN
jgi:hypothetical protein